MIRKSTKIEIKGFLEGFLQGMVAAFAATGIDPRQLRPPRAASTKGELKPFHEAILPEGILRVAEFERSFSTKTGTTFEEVARLIARDNHAVAERGYTVNGLVSKKTIATIESIVDAAGRKRGISETFLASMKRVLSAGGKANTPRSFVADIYLKTYSGVEFFFEIKSPKPNKGQCLEATSRLLQMHALRNKGRPRVNAFYAMAYNPFGRRADYNHSFALNYLDMKNQVLLGDDFWTIIGGPGTYRQVLSLYREVGLEKGPAMLDQLALGY